MIRKFLTVGVATLSMAGSIAGSALAGAQFVDANGVANFGYDVVAYHAEFAAVKGAPAFAVPHNGATFWFKDAVNRDRFAARPEAFAPAYDGHCAFAVARHKKLTVDPEAFSIVNPATGQLVDRAAYSIDAPGILYLNYSPDVNAQFNGELPGIKAAADFAWEGCLETWPAAKPKKGLRDLLGGKRPKSCPPAP